MSRSNQFALLRSRRFTPLFITQFLGAFHDNLFKNAMVVALLYSVGHADMDTKMLTTLAAGLFILPFVLFSALGGELADKYPKDKVIRIIKLAEIAIACLGGFSLLSRSIPWDFATLFALGTHSAFFGPSKYSILPQHLRNDELIGGNAVLNTGTFLAILTGTVAGTSLINLDEGGVIVSTCLFLCACAGWFTSRFIPTAPPERTGESFNFNPASEMINVMRYTLTRSRDVTRSIYGISWFYFLGGMFVAQLPNLARDTLNVDEHTLSLFLVCFSIGIAAGGLFNNRLLAGRIETTYVPYALFGVTIFSLDLCLASHGDHAAAMRGLTAFLSDFSGWRITTDLILIAISGGLFVVPLDAIVQSRTPEAYRARVQAGNAIVNSLFMVAASGISAALIGFGWSEPRIIGLFAVTNLAAVIYSWLFKPASDSGAA